MDSNFFVTETERDRLRDELLNHTDHVDPQTGKRVGTKAKVPDTRVSRYINQRPHVFKGIKTNATSIERFLDLDDGRVKDETVWVLGVYLSEIKRDSDPFEGPCFPHVRGCDGVLWNVGDEGQSVSVVDCRHVCLFCLL